MTPSQFLTMKEAALLVGKSASSIHRIIEPIKRDDKHSDRGHVQPSVEEVMNLRMKGENFAWRISEELLRREIPIETTQQKASASPTQKRSASENAELIAMLRVELGI